jgi:hypothetical protein
VQYIAVLSNESGDRSNKLYNIINYNKEAFECLQASDEDAFLEEIRKYNAKHGALDLELGDLDGKGILELMIDARWPCLVNSLRIILGEGNLTKCFWPENLTSLGLLIEKSLSIFNEEIFFTIVRFFLSNESEKSSLLSKLIANHPSTRLDVIKQIVICSEEARPFFVSSHMLELLLDQKVSISDFAEIEDQFIAELTSPENAKYYVINLPQCFRSIYDAATIKPQHLLAIPTQMRDLVFSSESLNLFEVTESSDIRTLLDKGVDHLEAILQSPVQVLSYQRKGIKLHDLAQFSIDQLSLILDPGFESAISNGQDIKYFVIER